VPIDPLEQEAMYAVIESGGKQYRVELGAEIQVDRLDASPGDAITLDRVLLVADGDATAVGQPLVDGATVSAEVLRQERGEKITVFKYKPKARTRVKQGHRAELTTLRIADIAYGGKSASKDARQAESKRDKARRDAEQQAEQQAAADRELAAKLAAAAPVVEPEASKRASKTAARAAEKTKPVKAEKSTVASAESTELADAEESEARASGQPTSAEATDAVGADAEAGPESVAGTAEQPAAQSEAQSEAAADADVPTDDAPATDPRKDE
jgi:large subunit ribosomal protein L21